MGAIVLRAARALCGTRMRVPYGRGMGAVVLRVCAAVLLAVFACAAVAIEDVELNAEADEARYNELANTLRCMVCQNQTIADSNAELARDFRNQVKQQINLGLSNEEIADYMTARYGDYILYRPPFNAATALLWLGPFILAAGGLVVIARVLKRRRRPPADEEQRARLNKLLHDARDADEG